MRNEEYGIQKSCVKWFNYKNPTQKGLLYMNMNNPRNKVNGKLMKDAGMVAGVSDLTYLYGGKVYFIEVKTKTGKLSENQLIWSGKIMSFGYSYSVVRSLDDFMSLINLIQNRKL